jgi:hypothetical protein
MKRSIEILLVVLACAAAPARAQFVVGGGDPLMLLFADARPEAVAMLDAVADQGTPTGVDSAVATFLARTVPYEGEHLPMPRAMARELERANLNWRAGDPAGLDKCAAIELQPGSFPDIYLSLSKCRAVLGLSPAAGALAAQTLIHEASHRFGLGTTDADEDLASKVGVAVFNIWRARRVQLAKTWADTALDGAPAARAFATAVWTGAGDPAGGQNQLIIWGGCSGGAIPGTANCEDYPRAGGRLVLDRAGTLGEPPSSHWLPLPPDGAPVGRKLHSAIFTGETHLPSLARKMIVFGGCTGAASGGSACSRSLGVTGSDMLDPATEKWFPVAAAGAPSPRVAHSAVWTADDTMIVFGGLEGFQNPAPDRALGDGAILSFSESAPAGVWTPLPSSPHAPSPRFAHTAVWTNAGMVVFGGCAQSSPNPNRCARTLNDGAIFDPHAPVGTDPWTPLPAAPIRGRTGHSLVWSGRYLIVWGGDDNGTVLSDGARFDLVTKSWSLLSPNLPSLPGSDKKGRRDHSAALEPLRGRMIVWGGTDGAGGYPDRTWIYDIDANSWTDAATATDPAGRVGHVGAWIQDALFVWGGYNAQSGFLGQGGLFNP